MEYITKSKSNKSQIKKDIAFCSLFKSELPDETHLITDLFKGFNVDIKKIDSKIAQGALSNASGNWYEWLLAAAAWNCFIDNPKSHLAVLLPNVTSFDVSKLYISKLSSFVADLKEKVSTTGVKLITSNPDFVIINRRLVDKINPRISKIKTINLDTLKDFENAYKNFIGQCEYEDIEGFIAAGKIDVVVVYKVDRLTRALSDFAKIIEVFDKQNVSFVSVTQAFNTTNSMGRLIAKGFYWSKLIRQGLYKSSRDIAVSHGHSVEYVKRALRQRYLSPELIKYITNNEKGGKQIGVDQLIKLNYWCWKEQSFKLSF